MAKWDPDKITAVTLLVGCLGLLYTGIDGEVKSILLIAAGYLFGSGVQERRRQQ